MPTIRVFDFDLTLTREHTFAEYAKQVGDSDDVQYRLGRMFARSSNKIHRAVADYFVIGQDHINAIATYHNNPAFIAGFIEGLTNRKLTHQGSFSMDHHEFHGVVVERYQVEGETTPILIAHLSGTGMNHAHQIHQLTAYGKNEHLEFLRKLMLELKLLSRETETFQFFDDTLTNVTLAARLPNVEAYHVEMDVRPTLEKTTPTPSTVEPSSLPPTSQSTNSSLSAHLFFQIMNTFVAKALGIILLVAGLAALAIGSCGIAGILAGLSITTSLTTMAAGAGGVLMAAGLLGIFGQRPKPENLSPRIGQIQPCLNI